MREFCIYMIHNIVNNKVYIGKTNDIKKRWARHRANVASKNMEVKKPIHWAIKKYGLDNFIFSVIQKFTSEEECLKAETYWIRHFKSTNRKYGYNLAAAGMGSSGFQLSQKTKDKISRANKGLKRTESMKKFRSDNMLGSKNHFYGKTHSEEMKIKLSGENSKSAKLSSNQVNDIIYLFNNKIHSSQRQLSKMYCVSQQHISRIINRLRRARG
jgi:group I intron endonuclease